MMRTLWVQSYCTVVHIHVMKAYRCNVCLAPLSFSSALYGLEWSASCLRCFPQFIVSIQYECYMFCHSKLGIIFTDYHNAPFLKLGTAKGCQGPPRDENA